MVFFGGVLAVLSCILLSLWTVTKHDYISPTAEEHLSFSPLLTPLSFYSASTQSIELQRFICMFLLASSSRISAFPFLSLAMRTLNSLWFMCCIMLCVCFVYSMFTADLGVCTGLCVSIHLVRFSVVFVYRQRLTSKPKLLE